MNNLQQMPKKIFTTLCILALLTFFLILSGCANTPDQVINVRVMTHGVPGNQLSFNISLDGKTVVDDLVINDSSPYVTQITAKSGLHRLKVVEKNTGAVVQAAVDSSPEQWFQAKYQILEDGYGSFEYEIQKTPWSNKEESPSKPPNAEQSFKDKESNNNEKEQKISDKFENLVEEAKDVEPWNIKS
jgi:hypothetical protein